MAGMGLALVAFLIIGVAGLADAAAGAAVLVFLQYTAQLAGGYIAGLLSGGGRVLHGGLAGILMAAVGTAIGMGFGGSQSNFVLLALAMAVAATIGSAGGALAEQRAARE